MPEFIVEHHLQSKILKTVPTGPWLSPVLGDFQLLAQRSLRTYWKPEAGRLVKRHKLKPVPDLIVVRDLAGEEKARWSCDQERDATGCS
jgi:hypothetical protein